MERHRAEAGSRVVIEGVEPEIDGGRFPIKRVVGEEVVVHADIFADGHDVLSAVLLFRHEHQPQWTEVPMKPLFSDLWQGAFLVTELGSYRYTIRAWVDSFKTWQHNLERKLEAGQDVALDLIIGAELVAEAARGASPEDAPQLQSLSDTLLATPGRDSTVLNLMAREETHRLMALYANKGSATTYPLELAVSVDPKKARFSTWYELFPRSCAPEPGQHATFKDCETRLPYIAAMGFDTLYLPPIHPIGRTHRKGRNNASVATPHDPGTPWAIGAEEGGHRTVHPQLGTLEEFQHLVREAQRVGIEVALDLAFQCSPDHPYVKEHPNWFRWRPDGTIQYAENPPKRYEDILPLDFEADQRQELWSELRDVVLFWIDVGVRIFRVDNPHTKPFAFWEWLIAEVKARHPEVIFLAEAFTRPKVMYHLSKLGFTQSYTYFAWRNTKWELTQYFRELTQTDVREYFRPNLWPNTPDILTEYLQVGGRPAFLTRLILAATLGASYGIYGPPFELWESRPREQGSEEYLDSEKYEIKHWDLERADSLRDFIALVNRIRRENPALQGDRTLRFHPLDNDMMVCYSKHTPDLSNLVLVVVNLDPHHTQSGWVELPLKEMGIEAEEPYRVHDLLSDTRYLWHGPRNYVELNPHVLPAHLFLLRPHLPTGRDFNYHV